MNEIKVVIDRFEGEFALVETKDGIIMNMPQLLIPKDAQEGDVLRICIDREETERKKTKTREMMDRLFDK